jgi:hypothetical protein
MVSPLYTRPAGFASSTVAPAPTPPSVDSGFLRYAFCGPSLDGDVPPDDDLPLDPGACRPSLLHVRHLNPPLPPSRLHRRPPVQRWMPSLCR